MQKFLKLLERKGVVCTNRSREPPSRVSPTKPPCPLRSLIFLFKIMIVNSGVNWKSDFETHVNVLSVSS